MLRQHSTTHLGLYCHVPFCANRCAYCAFYQERPTKKLIEQYLSAVKKEFKLLNITRPFDTIYIGGGTPGILMPHHLDDLCQILTWNNDEFLPAEFSVEFSPATVHREKLEVLKKYHCNRITIGIQSFNPQTMQTLGRRQTVRQALEAYETAVSAGIQNIGIDLIFGIPGQKPADWLKDLQQAIALQPKHISTYNLTFENGTPLDAAVKSNMMRKKSDKEDVDFYLSTWNCLRKSGYRQYEISNFCTPGFESIHNSHTWQMQDWIGIGPSAHSQYNGKRFSNPSSISAWLASLQEDQLPHVDIETISNTTMLEDLIIFGLRMNDGINLKELKIRFTGRNFSKFETLTLLLEKEKLMQREGDFIRLTDKGRLVADSIAVEILDT